MQLSPSTFSELTYSRIILNCCISLIKKKARAYAKASLSLSRGVSKNKTPHTLHQTRSLKKVGRSCISTASESLFHMRSYIRAAVPSSSSAVRNKCIQIYLPPTLIMRAAPLLFQRDARDNAESVYYILCAYDFERVITPAAVYLLI